MTASSYPPLTLLNSANNIVGRFAPSPTGALHLGSLYTALASFLHTRAQQGKWLVRIDDLDTPRNVKGAAQDILKTLESFGLYWDDSVLYQSQCLHDYDSALEKLQAHGLLYPCTCSRKTLQEMGAIHVYNGYCRNQNIQPIEPYALRVKTDNHLLRFIDGLQGEIISNLAQEYGDFILKRKDGIIAYQLAVVVDDNLQQINQVVRGFDLLHETPKQLYIQRLLGFSSPDYLHVPIIVDKQGYKLSKQTKATAVDTATPARIIFGLLQLLQQQPPQELQNAPINELLTWAIANWKITALVGMKQVMI